MMAALSANKLVCSATSSITLRISPIASMRVSSDTITETDSDDDSLMRLISSMARAIASAPRCASCATSSDSRAVYVASAVIGMVDPGMWRFNTSDSSGTTLLPALNTDSTYNFAEAPLPAPDGQLYFLFANLPEIPSSHTPLILVRSAPDAVSDRVNIRPETFTSVNEALWALDASGIVLVESGDPNNWVGGAAT